MDVILLERIGKLGGMGEVVKVKDGYARNFLFPQQKALRATEANRAKFERDRSVLEAKNEERRKAAMGDSGKLEGKSFVILRQAGESGQLYGSVSTRDIAQAASTAGVQVSRNHVLLDTPIKTIGLYTVQIALHPELAIPVTLNVARSQDEADAQARGEVLTGPVSERAEALAAAEELFESETAAEATVDQTEAEEK
jgi:large subunit ribosomal protein L9